MKTGKDVKTKRIGIERDTCRRLGEWRGEDGAANLGEKRGLNLPETGLLTDLIRAPAGASSCLAA